MREGEKISVRQSHALFTSRCRASTISHSHKKIYSFVLVLLRMQKKIILCVCVCV